jgi:DNA-binding NtrC family response regulator
MSGDADLTSADILVVDDDPASGQILPKIFLNDNYHISLALNGPDGISEIQKEKPDLVILDLCLQEMSGIDILREIRKFDKNLLVIILTGYETVKTAVEAMKLGAYDYLVKPIDVETIRTVVHNALKARAVLKEIAPVRVIKEELKEDRLVGNSLQMQEVLNLIKKLSAYDITVYLQGESGTGKEMVARALHQGSKRAGKPFIVIDCAALPETLLESELFGYEKGAFTGAQARSLGRFELAQGGTVFLDEIGNLSPNVQMKLLRALQEKRIERLGGNKLIDIDFRLIAASNINLDTALKEGKFREDLYYRLNVFSIILPPLRERDGDIDLLIDHFLKKFTSLYKKDVRGLSPEAGRLLNDYAWPGNIRELRNVLESGVVLAENRIEASHLPLKIQMIQETTSPFSGSLKAMSREARKDFEKHFIEKVLLEFHWNKSKASKSLGVDYKTLLNKIKEYKIAKPL